MRVEESRPRRIDGKLIMITIRKIRRRMRNVAAPLLGSMLLVYFGYHAIEGERGLLRWLTLRQQLQETKRVAARFAAERQSYEQRVRLLSSKSLDLDMLEEQARSMLNYGKEGDLVILDTKD